MAQLKENNKLCSQSDNDQFEVYENIQNSLQKSKCPKVGRQKVDHQIICSSSTKNYQNLLIILKSGKKILDE